MNLAFSESSLSSIPIDAYTSQPAEIVADLLRAAHRIRGALSTHFAEFGLSDARYSVLRIVRDSAPKGCTQTELADRLQQSESSISTLVDRMRAANLLLRLRSKADRRKCLLIPTDLARETLERLERCHHERMADLLACFTSTQLSDLSTLLKVLDAELTRRESTDAAAAPATVPHLKLSIPTEEIALRPAG